MKTNYFGQDRYRHTRIWLRLIWLQSERDSKEALKPNGLSCKSNNKDSSYCIVSRKRSKPLYMEQTNTTGCIVSTVSLPINVVFVYLYTCSKQLCLWSKPKATGCSWSSNCSVTFFMSLANLIMPTTFL